jgi:glutathione S-transferase
MKRPTLVIGNKNYSSWSLRAWLVLREASIEFDEVRIPLHTAGYRDRIREHNPAGKVPVLLDGSRTVWDSLAIAEYVAERVPSIWPADPAARARARSVSAEMHSSFFTIRQMLPLNVRAAGRTAAATADLTAEIDRVAAIWETCREAFGASGPCLFGAFSIADAFFAPVVLRFRTYGVSCRPVGQAYMEALRDRPSLREWTQAAAAESEIIEAYEVGRPEPPGGGRAVT